MINKNVADYTNFDGKTNKKIVQAPGGASSMNLGWSNDKTDYGPDRHYKKKDNYGSYNEQLPAKNYQQGASYNYNEPIRVMEEKPQYDLRQEQLYSPKQEVYSSHSIQSSSSNPNSLKIGGEYGYNQYTHNHPPNYGEGYNKYQEPYNNQKRNYQQETLDMAIQEQTKSKDRNTPNIPRPPQIQQEPSKRPCVKIHQQKSTNFLIGDGGYNYWKDGNDEGRKSNSSSRKTQQYENYGQQQQQQQPQIYQSHSQEKTSVRVKNPPGGKGSFILG